MPEGAPSSRLLVVAERTRARVRGGPTVSAGAAKPAVLPGPDGKPRCTWGISSTEYLEYHDREWGYPVVDDDGLFERLCLEGFQSGLSWLTILRKREGFRSAFAGFRIEDVAAFDERDVARLLADEGIVRNRRKIEATINNAAATLKLVEDLGSFAEFMWSFAPAEQPPRRSLTDIPATTEESKRLASELKRRGYQFVGPTTVYASMQACGLVNDHVAGCYGRNSVEDARSLVLQRHQVWVRNRRTMQESADE
jgi:DNA-3-methyladenine glycosylase I